MPLHAKQSLPRYLQFWVFSGGQSILHPGVWWKSSQCPRCFWVGLQTSKLLLLLLHSPAADHDSFFSSSWNDECRLADQIVLVVWGVCCGCRCGQNQTGYFLNGVLAPDGVLGLGTGEISVPSTLSRELGLLDSFSICTNGSGTGRIAFGDTGPITQQTTPFVSNSRWEQSLLSRPSQFCPGRSNFVHVASKEVFIGSSTCCCKSAIDLQPASKQFAPMKSWTDQNCKCETWWLLLLFVAARRIWWRSQRWRSEFKIFQ